jgi:hypothetical protein
MKNDIFLREDNIIEILKSLSLQNDQGEVLYDFVKNNAKIIQEIITKERINYNDFVIFNHWNPLMFFLNYSQILTLNHQEIDNLLKKTDLNMKNDDGLTALSLLLSIPKEQNFWSNTKVVDILSLSKEQILYIIKNTNLNNLEVDYLSKGLEYNNPLWIMDNMIIEGVNLYKNDYFLKLAIEKNREDFMVLLFDKYHYRLPDRVKVWLKNEAKEDILLLENIIHQKNNLNHKLKKDNKDAVSLGLKI